MKKIYLYSLVFLILLTGCNNFNRDIDDKNKQNQNPISIFERNSTNLDIIYRLVVDIDGDLKPEHFIVSGTKDPKLWYIDETGIGRVVADGKGTDYLQTLVIERGNENHIAFFAEYPPSNTKLWVITPVNGEPKEVFDFTTDWEIRIIKDGFNMVWKEYKEEGGYNLSSDEYLWDKKEKSYKN